MKKLVILGAGAIGRFHAEAAIALNSNVKLQGVYDVNQEGAQAFAKTYGCKAYATLNAALNSRPDLIAVCTPPMSHHSVSIPFLKRGVHALIEKPLASYTWQARQILAAAKEGGARVMTCCQRDFLSPAVRVQRAVDDGWVGPFISVHARINGHRDWSYYHDKLTEAKNWKGMIETEGGALLVNQAPHHKRMMTRFMGPLASVTATVCNMAHPYIDGEDHVVGTCRFKKGGVGSFHFSNIEDPGYYAGITLSDRKGRTIEIQTDARMFVAGQGGQGGGMSHIPCINQWTGVDARTLAQWNREDAVAFYRDTEDAQTKQYHVTVLAEFLAAIEQGRSPAITGEDGLETVMFADACFISSAEGGIPITLPLVELDPSHPHGRDKIIRLCDM